jgi:hypothetical protein
MVFSKKKYMYVNVFSRHTHSHAPYYIAPLMNIALHVELPSNFHQNSTVVASVINKNTQMSSRLLVAIIFGNLFGQILTESLPWRFGGTIPSDNFLVGFRWPISRTRGA